MGLISGLKSIFVGDEDIEEEIYSTYTPKAPAIPETEEKDTSDPEPVIKPSAVVEYPERPSREEQAQRRTQNQQRRAQAASGYETRAERSERAEHADRSDRAERSERTERRSSAVSDRNDRNERYSSRGRNNERGSDRMATTVQSSSFDLVLARPNNFKEVQRIGEDINDHRTVILNLELVKQEDATRILDFIWGVAFANDAEIKMMAQKTYAVIPTGVNFSGVDLVSELENSGYNF